MGIPSGRTPSPCGHTTEVYGEWPGNAASQIKNIYYVWLSVDPLFWPGQIFRGWAKRTIKFAGEFLIHQRRNHMLPKEFTSNYKRRSHQGQQAERGVS